MSAPARLDPAREFWMTAPATAAVMDAISPGDSDRARFVGGAVRDALAGRTVEDIDIATTLTPQAAAQALGAAGLKVVPTGIDHGTITAVAFGKPFEITTLRRDVETFGRRAVVAFTTDWAEDAIRRDFRMNAIYADRFGALFDPFDGVADARAGRVVFIGEPRERIAEDHLRILRFYRFNAWYGAGIDPEGQAACAELATTLEAVSAERIWKEFRKLLLAPDPREAVRAMHAGHVLERVLTARLDLNLFEGIINADRGKSRNADALVRLAALLGRDEGAMGTAMTAMKASNAESARALAVCGPAPVALRPGLSTLDLGRALYRLGADAVAGRLRLDEAQGLGDCDAELAIAADWTHKRFPLTGKDLIARGYRPGPALGAALGALEERWIASGFVLDREALLDRLPEAGG